MGFAIAISREFPIPGIPRISREFSGIHGNTVLQFPSRKSGMEFFTLIPVPENGNGILWNFHSRSRKLDWNFPLGFPFPKNGNGICHFPFPFPKFKSHSRSWLLSYLWKLLVPLS